MLGLSAYILLLYADEHNGIKELENGWIGEKVPNSIFPLEIPAKTFAILSGYQLGILSNNPVFKDINGCILHSVKAPNSAYDIIGCAGLDWQLNILLAGLLSQALDEGTDIKLNQINFINPTEDQAFLIDCWKGDLSPDQVIIASTPISPEIGKIDVCISLTLGDKVAFLKQLKAFTESNFISWGKGTNLLRDQIVVPINKKSYLLTFTGN
jgi:hypothetical protein